MRRVVHEIRRDARLAECPCSGPFPAVVHAGNKEEAVEIVEAGEGERGGDEIVHPNGVG